MLLIAVILNNSTKKVCNINMKDGWIKYHSNECAISNTLSATNISMLFSVFAFFLMCSAYLMRIKLFGCVVCSYCSVSLYLGVLWGNMCIQGQADEAWRSYFLFKWICWALGSHVNCTCETYALRFKWLPLSCLNNGQFHICVFLFSSCYLLLVVVKTKKDDAAHI